MQAAKQFADGHTKGATTMSITTLIMTTFSIKGLFGTLGITTFSISDTQHNSTSVTTLRAIILNVVRLSVVAPFKNPSPSSLPTHPLKK
jgi:hypothetical protein